MDSDSIEPVDGCQLTNFHNNKEENILIYGTMISAVLSVRRADPSLSMSNCKLRIWLPKTFSAYSIYLHAAADCSKEYFKSWAFWETLLFKAEFSITQTADAVSHFHISVSKQESKRMKLNSAYLTVTTGSEHTVSRSPHPFHSTLAPTSFGHSNPKGNNTRE